MAAARRIDGTLWFGSKNPLSSGVQRILESKIERLKNTMIHYFLLAAKNNEETRVSCQHTGATSFLQPHTLYVSFSLLALVRGNKMSVVLYLLL